MWLQLWQGIFFFFFSKRYTCSSSPQNTDVLHPWKRGMQRKMEEEFMPKLIIIHRLDAQWLTWHKTPSYLLAVILKGEQVHYDPFDEALKEKLSAVFLLSSTCVISMCTFCTTVMGSQRCVAGGSCHKDHFCCDTTFVTTNTFVMTKHIFCRDKSMLAATKLFLSWQTFCTTVSYDMGWH